MKLGVPFQGLWLTADPGVMATRIGSRQHDASDATVDVAAAQLARGAGQINWVSLDASGCPRSVHAAAMRALALG